MQPGSTIRTDWPHHAPLDARKFKNLDGTGLSGLCAGQSCTRMGKTSRKNTQFCPSGQTRTGISRLEMMNFLFF